MKKNLKSGLVLSKLAALKFSEIKLKYATFGGSFICFLPGSSHILVTSFLVFSSLRLRDFLYDVFRL